MYIKNRLKYVRFILPLMLIAGVLVFIPFETKPTSVSELNDQNMSHLLDCGYIRRNIENTIFHPNFVLYLSRQQNKYNALNESHVRNAVDIWNSAIADKRKIIHYQQEHFNKLAMLSKTMDDCDDDGCAVNNKDLAVLRYWMSDLSVEIAEPAIIQTLSPSKLKHLNIEDDKDIGKALEIISKDPVGKQLIAYAISQNIIIRSEKLHNHKGYFECPRKTIVIDPTVASYIFKINCIVHELVHATNPGDGNSVAEETFAEIIGMAVQDRITDIDISCNPYVVFIDRLLDSHYGKYPVKSNIEGYLRQAGIVIKNANVKTE